MKKKTIALLMAGVLAVGCVIGGTLAWLTSTTDTVVNTFTVGDINLTLTEEGATQSGTTLTKDYKIIPGTTADKKPVLTVENLSEKCYVYASVENTVKLNGVVVATPNIDAAIWVKVGENGDKAVYRYMGVEATNGIVDASTAKQELEPVFTQVTYSDTITKADIQTLANTTITINGYAHQSEGDGMTMAAADTAACTHFAVAAVTP